MDGRVGMYIRKYRRTELKRNTLDSQKANVYINLPLKLQIKLAISPDCGAGYPALKFITNAARVTTIAKQSLSRVQS